MFIAQDVKLMPVDALLPYARNTRTHDDKQVAALATSIREFGFTSPVLVRDDGTIVAGHGRVLAARKLNMDHVPTINLGHLTEAQARAYVIADNKLAEQAGWDDDLLKLEVADLTAEGYDMSLIGFDSSELECLLAASVAGTSGLTDPDATPEPPADPASRVRDVWLLGAHRLMCGDSTNAEQVQKLLGGGVPHLMVTDPPYGVEYDPTRTSNNPMKSGKVLNDDRSDWREAWALFHGDVAYVWHASMFTHVMLESLESCGFKPRAMIVWVKDKFTLGRGHYHWQHEPAWYVVRKGATGHWEGGRKQTSTWHIKAREDGGHGHGTQKPIECMRRPIENNSRIGDSVYEPFSGSGTTIIAAEQTKRKCYAMELSPAYVDVGVRRWQEFTGLVATLESDGRTFADVALARKG